MTVPSSGRLARTVTTKLTGLVAAYLLVDITVHDRDSYISEYLPPVDSLIAKHGGKVTHRITGIEALEGSWEPERLLLIEFPDRAAVEAFWRDPDYEPVKEIRLRTATSIISMGEDQR